MYSIKRCLLYPIYFSQKLLKVGARIPTDRDTELWVLAHSHIVRSRTGFQAQGFLKLKFRVLMFAHMAWSLASLFISSTRFPFSIFLDAGVSQDLILYLPYIPTHSPDNITCSYGANSSVSFNFSLGSTTRFQRPSGLFTRLLKCPADSSEKHMLTARLDQVICLFGHPVLHLWHERARAAVFKFSNKMLS